jgi:hypothetical protein
MIRSVCGDHESAAYHRDEDLCRMRWKPISPICATENEKKSDSHERQHAQRAMSAESSHQCNGSKSGNGNGKGSMSFLFRREKMRRDCGDGKYNRSQQAMDDARSRCPNTNLVHRKSETGLDCPNRAYQ